MTESNGCATKGGLSLCPSTWLALGEHLRPPDTVPEVAAAAARAKGAQSWGRMLKQEGVP